MSIKRLVRAIPITGMAVFMMAASATAATITYNTDSVATGFNGGGPLVLNSIFGAAATLTYNPNGDTVTGVPSNVNFGTFTLACPTCSSELISATIIPAFTFDLVITDVTDGATGMFVGTSTGGIVLSNVSQVTVNWAPLVLGPGTTNALSGNFGPTIFSTTVFTGIVAPNSGDIPGQSTVQGFVTSNAVPEPATLGLVGGALLALGTLGRKRISRQ